MKKLLFILVITVAFTSCKKDEALKNYMIGTWQSTYFKVTMPTFDKSLDERVMEDDFSKENATLAQSKYKEDGTFKAWYVKSDGTKTGETDGTWAIKNDSLQVSYTLQGRQVNAMYSVEKTPEGFQAKSLNDWDNDGQKDDMLEMKTKRIQ